VDIERAVLSDRKRACWKQQPVGGDHQRLRPCGYEPRQRALVLQVRRLEDFKSAFKGEPLDRTGRGSQATARRTVRLGKYQGNLMPRPKQGGQRLRCELGSAGEDETQERTRQRRKSSRALAKLLREPRADALLLEQ